MKLMPGSFLPQRMQITKSEETRIHRENGSARWRLTEFDHGAHYILTIEAGMSFTAHFTREQFEQLRDLLDRMAGS